MKKYLFFLIVISVYLLPSLTFGEKGKCNKGDCENGRGTMTFSRGDKYVGDFKGGKYHGQGTYYYIDGSIYTGEWKHGKYHGRGTYTLPDSFDFVGEFKEGIRDGQGIETAADGFKYIGEYKDGVYHGYGTLTSPQYGKYEGEFKYGFLLQALELGAQSGLGFMYYSGDGFLQDYKQAMHWLLKQQNRGMSMLNIN